MLQKNNKSIKLFEYVCAKFKISEGRIMSTSSDLSLFLTLRSIYKDQYDGASKQFDNIMNVEIFKDKKMVMGANGLVKHQTYLYPRLHSSTCLLVKELFRDKKHLGKNVETFFKVVLEDSIFNEDIHSSMKSVAKMKYLHIGFKIAEMVIKGVIDGDFDSKLKIKVINCCLNKSKNFRNMLIKNV